MLTEKTESKWELKFKKNPLLQDLSTQVQVPKLILNLQVVESSPTKDGEAGAQANCYEPVFLSDIRRVLFSTIDFSTSGTEWCTLLRRELLSKVLFVHINGMSRIECKKHGQDMNHLCTKFLCSVNVVSPSCYNSSVVHEIFAASGRKQINCDYSVAAHTCNSSHLPSCNPMVDSSADTCTSTLHSSFNTMVTEKGNGSLEPEASFCNILSACENSCQVVDLLLSLSQMVSEGYPVPVIYSSSSFYVYSKDAYTPVSESSPIFGLDCEMCQTTASVNELTRITLVDGCGTVIYDSLVKPSNVITNYLTKYSGITRKMLNGVTVGLCDVQEKLSQILPSDAILCGHSLDSDLHALRMYHPYVIDTSIIYNFSGHRSMKPSLRQLVSHYLKREIQSKKTGHCSAEDAQAVIDLVKLKLSRPYKFGDSVTCEDSEISVTREESFDGGLSQNLATDRLSFFQLLEKKGKCGSIVTHDLHRNIVQCHVDSSAVNVASCADDSSIVGHTQQLLSNRGDTFLMAQLHWNCGHCALDCELKRQKCVKRMDRFIGKLYKSLPEKSLMLVLMSPCKTILANSRLFATVKNSVK